MIKLWRFLSVPIVLAVCLGLLLVPAMLPLTVSAAETAGIEALPSKDKVGFAETFTVDVVINNPASEPINTVAAEINFTPGLISATNITVDSVWTLVTLEEYDNVTGTISVAAGIIGANTSASSIPVCTVDMVSADASGIAALDFVFIEGVRETRVYNAETGEDILNWTLVVNGAVEVGTTLTVNVTPAGKGDVEIGGVIPPGGYPDESSWGWGSVVTLEAVDSVPGWVFDYWSGDLSGSTNLTTITMNETTKNVTANFYGQYPEISPDPSSLTFNANVGGANPANKTLDICNGGGGILNWTANITGPNAILFSMSPMNGTNLTAAQCNSTEVAVNTTNLTEGTYYANITINSTEVNETVPVTLNLGVPVISTTPTSLTFTTNEGENPPDQTLEVCNSGTGILDWSLTDGNTAWLSVAPTSGSLPEDECEDVTVSVDVTGLAPGDYSATITITGSPTMTVPVNLHIVSAMPEILVGPAQLSASALSISPQQVQPGQDVTISINVANTGGETGSYNAILYINGVVVDSQSVSVAAGTSKNVIFTVSKSAAGVYDVSLAGQSGQFEVVSTGWFAGGLGTGGIVAIVVVVIALIVALVFILRGTRREV